MKYKYNFMEWIGIALIAVAEWFVAAGQHDRAVAICVMLEHCDRLPAYHKRNAGYMVKQLQQDIPEADFQAAAQQGRQLEIRAVAQQLLTEFGEDEA